LPSASLPVDGTSLLNHPLVIESEKSSFTYSRQAAATATAAATAAAFVIEEDEQQPDAVAEAWRTWPQRRLGA
jgi:hypothetical protein